MRYTQGEWRVDGQFDAGVSVQVIVRHPEHGDLQVIEIEPLLDNWSEEEIANVRLMASSDRLFRLAKYILESDYSSLTARSLAERAIATAEGRA